MGPHCSSTSLPAPAPHNLTSMLRGYHHITDTVKGQKKTVLFTCGGQDSRNLLGGPLRGARPAEEGRVPLSDTGSAPRISLKPWGFWAEALTLEAEQEQIVEHWLVSLLWLELPISPWASQALQTPMFSRLRRGISWLQSTDCQDLNGWQRESWPDPTFLDNKMNLS